MTTAAEIRVALKRHFPHPRFGIVFEVAQGAGWKANRHLDAMAMGVWPSQGLVLHGIEIKVSRGDWRRELAIPEKAEQMARFCDFFWLAAPEGVVPVEELPANWGLLELKGPKLRQVKAAEKLQAAQLSKDLMAAVFRAACRPVAADEVAAGIAAGMALAREELEKNHEARVTREIENRTYRDAKAAEKWRALLNALGDDDWTPENEVIAAVKLVMALGVGPSRNGAQHVLQVLDAATKSIRAAMEPMKQAEAVS